MTIATFRFYVDWNRDGDTSDSNEEITSYVMDAAWNLGFREAYKSIAGVTKAQITLDNTSGLFSPENSGGALYGVDWSQRPFRVDAVYPGGTVTMFTGWTDEIIPTTGVTIGDQTAMLTAYGADTWLKRAKFAIDLQINVTADEVMNEILETVKVPPATPNGPWLLGIAGNSELGNTTYLQASGITTDFDTGRVNFSYVGDTWTEETPVYNAFGDLAEAERGRVFVNRGGDVTFWNNAALLTDTTIDETMTDAQIGMQYHYLPAKTTHNRITLTAQPRELSADDTETLWDLQEPITIPPGKTEKIEAHLTDQTTDVRVAAIDVRKPNALDGTLAFSQGEADLTMFEMKMVNVIMELRNDGTIPAIVETLTIRGRKLTTYNKFEVEERDGESIVAIGERHLKLDIGLLQSESIARNVAAYELFRRKDARGEIQRIDFVSASTASLNRAMQRVIGDRYRITESKSGHTGDYIIVGEEHRLLQGLNHHLYSHYLESADTQEYWLLGTTGRGELGQATYVGPI